MFKKFVIVLMLITIASASLFAGPVFSIDKQKGGLIPCLLGVFDTRMGYMANEKAVNVDLIDLLKPVLSVIGLPVMPLYTGYLGYQNAKGIDGCCIGMVGGYQTANMMGTTKGRTIEWLMYIPVVNIYSLIVYITETMGGKTWSEVVAKEKLLRK